MQKKKIFLIAKIQMNNQTYKIINNTYTKSGFYHKAALLKEFFEYTFFSLNKTQATKELLSYFLKEKESGESKKIINDLLSYGDDFYTKFNTENFQYILKEITNDINLLPNIKIYLPVKFSDDEISHLGEWFRKNINENIFMDVEVDSSIVAGCAFVWNSIYYNFSFKNSVKKREEEIISMINQFNQPK